MLNKETIIQLSKAFKMMAEDLDGLLAAPSAKETEKQPQREEKPIQQEIIGDQETPDYEALRSTANRKTIDAAKINRAAVISTLESFKAKNVSALPDEELAIYIQALNPILQSKGEE